MISIHEKRKKIQARQSEAGTRKTSSQYLAKMAFQVISGDGKHTAQFDEQFRIFEAGHENEALEKARKKGQEETHSFLNEREEAVHWKFIGVLELIELKELGDGTQIYANTEEAEDAAQYISRVKQKERTIETLSNFVYLF